MLINENTNVINLFNNNLLLRDYFLKCGLTEVVSKIDFEDAEASATIDNIFFMQDESLTYQMVDYHIKANLDYFLFFIFEYLTKNEIKQIVSMFKFHNNLFNKPTNKKTSFQIIISQNVINLLSEIINIDIDIIKNKYFILQRTSFSRKPYELDKVYFNDLHTIITNQLKCSLSLYTGEHIDFIDNKIINNVLNESNDDYYKRFNNENFFNLVNDNDFYTNIINNFSYELQNTSNFNTDEFNYFIDTKDILLLTNEKSIKIHDMKNGVSIYSHIHKTGVIRKLLSPLFINSDLSYILSIISILKFFEQMNNPYSSYNTLIINRNSTNIKSKSDVIFYEYAYSISFNRFDIRIGKNIDIYYMKNRYQVNDLKSAYKKLIDITIEKIISTLNIDPENLTFEHIKLQQMFNS